MRGLKRFIILFFIVIVGLPLAIGGASLVKDENPPEYLVEYDETFKSQDVFMKKLKTIALSNVLGVSSIYIDEVTVNKMIYENAKGFKDAKLQISDDEFVKLDYVWTHFDDNELSIYALFGYKSISTTMTLKLGFSEAVEGLKISLNQFKVGQMPIPNMVFSFAINQLVEYAGLNLKDEYNYGELNYDKLYVTVEKQHIQKLINDNLDNDMILFDSITLDNGKFTFNYEFNTAGNPQAQAIQATIDELNALLNDSTRVTELTDDVEGVLDLTDESQNQFNDDFIAAINLLQTQVADPENIDLSDEDQDLLASMGSSFAKLDSETQELVAAALEDNFSPDLNDQVNNAGIAGYDSITDLLVSGE